MANPRNTVAFDDIGSLTATFIIDNSTIVYDATKANGSVSVGLAVTTTGQTTGIIALSGDGERVTGKLLKVEADNKATVQVGGFMKLPGGTSATLTQGTKIVGDLLVSAKGYIQTASNQYTVMDGEIIDPSTATAVVVKL